MAGIAELLLSAGLVAWLQRSHPSLLVSTAPGAANIDEEAGLSWVAAGWRSVRPLLALLAALMLAAPLGILAVGTAWGEWSPRDFADASARREIVAASGHHPLPAAAPRGLENLSAVWTAPIPGYAPPFLKSAAFGYLLSAIFGVGLILVVALLAEWRMGLRRQAG